MDVNFSITSLLPVLFGASNWNETKHILMGVNFEINGMSCINVWKERSGGSTMRQLWSHFFLVDSYGCYMWTQSET